MEVDIVHHHAVFVVLQMHFDMVADPDAQEWPGYPAVEGLEVEGSVPVQPTLQFDRLEVHPYGLGVVRESSGEGSLMYRGGYPSVHRSSVYRRHRLEPRGPAACCCACAAARATAIEAAGPSPAVPARSVRREIAGTSELRTLLSYPSLRAPTRLTAGRSARTAPGPSWALSTACPLPSCWCRRRPRPGQPYPSQNAAGT